MKRREVIDIYSICYNEVEIIPYYLRHYETICDKIIIYDAYSNDGSRELFLEHPKVELRNLECNDLNDVVFKSYFDSIYKESRGVADWVFMTAIDEIIYYNTDIRDKLRNCRHGVVRTFGYNMVSNQFPTTDYQIYSEIKKGVFENSLCKPIIFNPNLDLEFSVGNHLITKPNNIGIYTHPDIKLLHFKLLGLDYFISNHNKMKSRLSETNITMGLGAYYLADESACIESFNRYLTECEDIDGL